MPRLSVAIVAVASTALLAACSSSSGGAGTPAGSVNAAAASAVGGLSSGAPAPTGSAGGGADCAAIPQADVQRLYKAAAPPVVANYGECDWGGGGITLDVYTDDPDRKYLSDLFGSGAKPLGGIGDYAVWSQAVAGRTVPAVGCHDGTTSVTVVPGLDVDNTTLKYTGSGPIFTVDAASAAKYAAEEGKLCSDIFAAQ